MAGSRTNADRLAALEQRLAEHGTPAADTPTMGAAMAHLAHALVRALSVADEALAIAREAIEDADAQEAPAVDVAGLLRDPETLRAVLSGLRSAGTQSREESR